MLMMMNKKNYFPMNQYTYTHCSCYSKLFSLLNECCTRFNVLSLLNCSLRCFFIYIEMAFWIFVFFFFVSFFWICVCTYVVFMWFPFKLFSLSHSVLSRKVMLLLCMFVALTWSTFENDKHVLCEKRAFLSFEKIKKNNNNKNKK